MHAYAYYTYYAYFTDYFSHCLQVTVAQTVSFSWKFVWRRRCYHYLPRLLFCPTLIVKVLIL